MFQTETEFVNWLQKSTARRSSQVKLGIGDDAALVRLAHGHDLILTSDLSIENIHFIRGMHPAHAIGHRALARSLSDIAAMGGIPRFVLVSVALPGNVARRWVEDFYRGLDELARRFGVTVIGGDTTVVSHTATVDVVVAGEVPSGKGLRRSGAKAGDVIFVSGCLGHSALGLDLLKSRERGGSRAARKKGTAEKDALHAHLYPEPRCKLGAFLRRRNLATSMMDLSDGLSLDLARLCRASNVGAKVWAERIRGPKGLPSEKSLNLALDGGEDYELLFTVSPAKTSKIPPAFSGVPLYPVGEITRSKNLALIRSDGTAVPLAAKGYDHFAKK